MSDQYLRASSYLFISLPGIVYTVTLLQRFLDKSCYCRKVPWLGRILANTCTLLMVIIITSVFIVYFLYLYPDDDTAILVMKVLAIIVGVVVLGVKILGVFVHTDNVKMINVKATAYEGVYESTLQLLLIMLVWLGFGGNLDISAMSSSLLMIGKSSAENFLTFGQENKMADRNILGRLKLIGKYLPVFLLTTIFRVTSLSVCCAWNYSILLMILLPAAFLLPMLVLFLLKLCGKLPHLTLADLVQGAVGELTSIVLWGQTGREGSRIIQAVMGGYLLLLYSVILVWVIANPTDINMPMPTLSTHHPELIISALVSGLVGYTLSLYQLFLFSKFNCDWRKKIDNFEFGLTGS